MALIQVSESIICDSSDRLTVQWQQLFVQPQETRCQASGSPWDSCDTRGCGYSSHCCGKTPKRSSVREGRFYFSSQFQGAVHHGERHGDSSCWQKLLPRIQIRKQRHEAALQAPSPAPPPRQTVSILTNFPAESLLLRIPRAVCFPVIL